jgi:hypothetical protein
MIPYNTFYYAATAYRSDRIPPQPPAEPSSWLKRFAKRRLPWGRTQEVAPDDFVSECAPEKLRIHEEDDEQKKAGTYVPAPFEHIDFHDRHDHERFRFALLPAGSHFWIYLRGFGKVGFFISLGPVLFTIVVAAHHENYQWGSVLLDMSKDFFPTFLGIPLLSWAIGSLVVFKFPKLWLKPSRGPIWELNRRTGLVTLFDYDNNGAYKKHGIIGELTAPFYEFDAYIETAPDRQGSAMNVLCIAHRYRDIVINLSSLVNIDTRWQIPCALWDFLQNYMDTSRPLPELPRYEEFRHLDPTTAEYDKRTGRNPRLWIDMDDATYQQRLHKLLGDIDNIDTFKRPNLMARYVRYGD